MTTSKISKEVFLQHLTQFFVCFSEDDFQNLQQAFLEKNYHEFEDTEENKFVYTDIHKEYVSQPSG